MQSLAFTQRKDIALNLARAIRAASWLGKHALNAQSRALAYAVKSQRISTALEHFEEFFKVSLAERNPRHGILILVHLPDGRGAHIPLASLTAAAQARLCGLVMAMIDPPSVQADESGARSHRFKDAA